MNWIKQSDREPTIKDLPFVTFDGKDYELWEDSDWFSELTDDDKAEYPEFMPLEPPHYEIKDTRHVNFEIKKSTATILRK